MPERDVITTGSAPTVMADSSPSPMALPAIGAVLGGGKYRVERVLGQGGMGVVVEAMHTGLMQKVAIKFLRNEAKSMTGALDRFAREARACAQVKSDHVVRVFDTGVFETGEPYIVMELLVGEDLRTMLMRRGVLTPIEAASFAIGACEALAEAHALGIVHRDLKPANLFVVTRADGSPLLKVLDFGISKLQSSEGGMQTSANVALGSPRYMSPEQIQSPRDVDARCDVWAMGVVLYEALAGRPPFEGEGIVAVAAAITTVRPRPLPGDVPVALANAVMKCLEKDRRLRHANASELAAALRPFATTEAQIIADRVVSSWGRAGAPISISTPPPASAPPISGFEPTIARSGTLLKQRSHRVEILVSTGVLVCIAGAIVFAMSLRTPRANTSIASPTTTPNATASITPVVALPAAPVESIAPLEAASVVTTAPPHVHASPPHPTVFATIATTAAPPPTVIAAPTTTTHDITGALRDRK